jgi:hypothetical protein
MTRTKGNSCRSAWSGPPPPDHGAAGARVQVGGGRRVREVEPLGTAAVPEDVRRCRHPVSRQDAVDRCGTGCQIGAGALDTDSSLERPPSGCGQGPAHAKPGHRRHLGQRAPAQPELNGLAVQQTLVPGGPGDSVVTPRGPEGPRHPDRGRPLRGAPRVAPGGGSLRRDGELGRSIAVLPHREHGGHSVELVVLVAVLGVEHPGFVDDPGREPDARVTDL